MQYPNLVDAVRERDGTQVMLKRVALAFEELPLSLYVLSEPRTCDPRNHCVQVLDVILIPACETHAIIVTPLLYAHAHLLFRRVGEFVEIAEQLVDVSTNCNHRTTCAQCAYRLQCLDFLHDHNIVHR